ncbi:MAG: hypothetical protein P4L87_20665 [Formivibrio sp.]|nr:hypothetical protein [Formivibrio sp.]
MTHAYIEHRPKSEDNGAAAIGHVVIVDGKQIKTTITQKAAADWALSQGYTVHVARERHLQDRDQPAHWRVYNGN